MRTPTMVRLDASNVQLLGIKQYVVFCPRGAAAADVIDVKLGFLFKLLERVQFTQCLIFCNYQDKLVFWHNLFDSNDRTKRIV